MQSCHFLSVHNFTKALDSKQEWEERFQMPWLQSSSLAVLPPIIIHFHDMQSLWEKSFVSFQHFPPHFSSTRTCPLVGSCPLIISFCSTSNVLDQHFLFDDFFFRLFVCFVLVQSLHSVQRYPAVGRVPKRERWQENDLVSVVFDTQVF